MDEIDLREYIWLRCQMDDHDTDEVMKAIWEVVEREIEKIEEQDEIGGFVIMKITTALKKAILGEGK